jgi:uncharacterized membrane protein YphA (DoxX/SURF4 family)
VDFKNRRELVSAIMRVVVGCILIYSGFIKISEPLENFYNAILGYKIVSGDLALISAQVVPWIEVYLGVLLVFGLFNKLVSIFSILLFLGFELLLAQAMIRGLEVKSCGCFGATHSNPIGVEFTLNLVWLSFLFLGYKFSYRFSLDRLIESKFSK